MKKLIAWLRFWLVPTAPPQTRTIYDGLLSEQGSPVQMNARALTASARALDAVTDFQVWLEQRMAEFEKECAE